MEHACCLLCVRHPLPRSEKSKERFERRLLASIVLLVLAFTKSQRRQDAMSTIGRHCPFRRRAAEGLSRLDVEAVVNAAVNAGQTRLDQRSVQGFSVRGEVLRENRDRG